MAVLLTLLVVLLVLLYNLPILQLSFVECQTVMIRDHDSLEWMRAVTIRDRDRSLRCPSYISWRLLFLHTGLTPLVTTGINSRKTRYRAPEAE